MILTFPGPFAVFGMNLPSHAFLRYAHTLPFSLGPLGSLPPLISISDSIVESFPSAGLYCRCLPLVFQTSLEEHQANKVHMTMYVWSSTHTASPVQFGLCACTPCCVLGWVILAVLIPSAASFIFSFYNQSGGGVDSLPTTP